MNTKVISSADIDACPIRSLSPAHYHDDGSCKCPPPAPPIGARVRVSFGYVPAERGPLGTVVRHGCDVANCGAGDRCIGVDLDDPHRSLSRVWRTPSELVVVP